jgi:predicted acyltransferase
MNQKVSLYEKSFLARIAAKWLHVNKAAIVFGSHIFLHGCKKQFFLSDEKWVRHELKHVLQYQQNGLFLFVVKYLMYSLKHGYYNNPFEVEARTAENDNTLIEQFTFE